MIVESRFPTKYKPHETKGVLELKTSLKKSIENLIAKLGKGNLSSWSRRIPEPSQLLIPIFPKLSPTSLGDKIGIGKVGDQDINFWY